MCILVNFECIYNKRATPEKWKGKIIRINRYGSHYEIQIDSRSGIMVVYGRTSHGGFACMPDFRVGCHLVNLKDRFWNDEQLTEILGYVDGITVSTALYTISDIIT